MKVSGGDNPQSPDADSSVLFVSIRTRATTGEGEMRGVRCWGGVLLGNVA